MGMVGAGGALGMGAQFGGLMGPMQVQGMHAMGYLQQQLRPAAAPAASADTGAAHSSAGAPQARGPAAWGRCLTPVPKAATGSLLVADWTRGRSS